MTGCIGSTIRTIRNTSSWTNFAKWKTAGFPLKYTTQRRERTSHAFFWISGVQRICLNYRENLLGSSQPMHILIVFWMSMLVAIPAYAEAYTNAFLRAEAGAVRLSSNKATASVTLAIANSTAGPYSIVFLSAALKDNRGNFFKPSGRPKGIPTGRPFTCEQGVLLTPEQSLTIDFSFRVSSRAMVNTAIFNFSGEFQAQRHTCENFTIILNNLTAIPE